MTREEAIKILYEMECKTAYSGELGGLAVDMAVEALRNQEKPSLPSDVDEAAEEYADKHPTCGLAKHSFKAGAEWMAGQGISSQGEINQTSGDNTMIELDECIDNFEDCEEVVVQIRKKP